MAFGAGADVFMTKPVRFREMGRILEGWMREKERESLGRLDLNGLTTLILARPMLMW
jgi:hypothetical protein